MIKDIIKAYNCGILNFDEAKSYIQRFLESSIQEIEASCEEVAAHTSEIMDRLECSCDCDYEFGVLPIDKDAEEAKNYKKEELSKEIAKLIKFFEL